MFIHKGAIALSDFRINKILTLLQSRISSITAVQPQFIHFGIIDGELNKKQEQDLLRLLEYGDKHALTEQQGKQLLVVPRPGTISPWSSKATDIAHNCGLENVSRLERGILWTIVSGNKTGNDSLELIHPVLHDRMTESVVGSLQDAEILFQKFTPQPYENIGILNSGKSILEKANKQMGLALSQNEIDYLYENFKLLDRNPTDVELMMFAQANSEHCRHKIFNAQWTIDDEIKEMSLFDLIRKTHELNPGRVLSAYSDNAAVLSGFTADRFYAHPVSHVYRSETEDVNILIKVETHNHPTAISPYPGASTGSGGEIRDEAATGRGAKPKAGLTGFTVSNLNIPNYLQPWENESDKPDRIASALEIMLDGPIGGASFNNEFGRPALCGFFRTYEQQLSAQEKIGYHKPIMIAGGFGSIRKPHIFKDEIPPTAKLIVLGGPAMLIGLGGGAASSMTSGESKETLDFASVQRDNPEMQRRCQEVINACWALDEQNPVISIHDVGAGGLSNALPELVSACERGAQFNLREIPNAEPGMSPMEIWCNEAQERYVLAVNHDDIETFKILCERERAPFAIIGEATAEKRLVLNDTFFKNQPIDIPLSLLLGEMPEIHRQSRTVRSQGNELDLTRIELNETVNRILRLPAVADKRFLITIGDRSVSGLVTRDQMVGPWQTPVADCAVTAGSFDSYVGEAMAMGERTPIAITNAAAASRMAIGEALMNICAARILSINDIALSANWMAACGSPGQDSNLYNAVEAASQFCQEIGICIPVGKDSLSMSTSWVENKLEKKVISPVSLIVSAFAPVVDVRQSLTPLLNLNAEDTVLVLIDLGLGKNRMGGSALYQVYNHIGENTPDVDHANDLSQFFQVIQLLNDAGKILAYHDRSDGGLFVTLCEMAFASRCGLDINLQDLSSNLLTGLFNEELGAVIQIHKNDFSEIKELLKHNSNLVNHLHIIASQNRNKKIIIEFNEKIIFEKKLNELHAAWSETTFQMRSLRDNPDCAIQEYEQIKDEDDPGLFLNTTFEIKNNNSFYINQQVQPKIAILREQGINGQVEMAAAFTRAGFECHDVHMSDLINGKISLDNFQGLVTCGGFSYGDVLGAGGGWANSILVNQDLRDTFESFFSRPDIFALGVCNGCQMFSHIREIIPGAEEWPVFMRNRSEQFESRLVMVEIIESPSILLQGMAGSKIPVIVAHGEGRTVFDTAKSINDNNHCMQFINNYGKVSDSYPANPNGSISGQTGFTSKDGRFTIMMPHPERVFLSSQHSWLSPEWQHAEGPWFQLFKNARKWVN